MKKRYAPGQQLYITLFGTVRECTLVRYLYSRCIIELEDGERISVSPSRLSVNCPPTASPVRAETATASPVRVETAITSPVRVETECIGWNP